MRNRGMLLLFSVALVCPAQVSTTSLSTKTYHSDAMNFDFAYPASFDDPSRSTEASDKENAGCITVPLTVTDMKTSFNMIVDKEYDADCSTKKQTSLPGLAEAATSTLTSTLSLLGKPVISSNANYEVAGHNASAVSGVVKVSGAQGNNVIHGSVSCVSTGKGIACFQFLANECSNLEALSSSKVKFLGSVAASVIPSGIGTACKQ